ncbi:hypothetical protein DH09_16035 [Bacillaceae bacterium JMAK1]|nr:hypothetical protein DH09_16035 [Bacillaceae bacterium JMAK1]
MRGIVLLLSTMMLLTGCALPGAQSAADGFSNQVIGWLFFGTGTAYLIYLMVTLIMLRKSPNVDTQEGTLANPYIYGLVAQRKPLFSATVQDALLFDLCRKGTVQKDGDTYHLVAEDELEPYEVPFASLWFKDGESFTPKTKGASLRNNDRVKREFRQRLLQEGKAYQESILRLGYFRRQSGYTVFHTIFLLLLASCGVVFMFAESNWFIAVGIAYIVIALITWSYVIQQNILTKRGQKAYGKAKQVQQQLKSGTYATTQDKAIIVFAKVTGLSNHIQTETEFAEIESIYKSILK